MHTSLHTSVRRVAVRSRISLCLIDGKPPLAHERACSTEKEAPQAHFDGSLSGVQPYRSARYKKYTWVGDFDMPTHQPTIWLRLMISVSCNEAVRGDMGLETLKSLCIMVGGY